jgi:Bacterial pre-peptidase C-terminal domain
VSQITTKETKCNKFRDGGAQTLSSVSYAVGGHGEIKDVKPDAFLYWVAVTVPAGSNTFMVSETITTGNFNTLFDIDKPKSKVFDSNCHDVHGIFTQNGGTVTVTFTAPAAGTYYLQVKYKTDSVNHDPAPSPTTVHYEFMTAGMPGSTSGLDLVRR